MLLNGDGLGTLNAIVLGRLMVMVRVLKAISASNFNKNVLRICHFLKINFKEVNLKEKAKICFEHLSSKKPLKITNFLMTWNS